MVWLNWFAMGFTRRGPPFWLQRGSPTAGWWLASNAARHIWTTHRMQYQSYTPKMPMRWTKYPSSSALASDKIENNSWLIRVAPQKAGQSSLAMPCARYWCLPCRGKRCRSTPRVSCHFWVNIGEMLQQPGWDGSRHGKSWQLPPRFARWQHVVEQRPFALHLLWQPWVTLGS